MSMDKNDISQTIKVDISTINDNMYKQLFFKTVEWLQSRMTTNDIVRLKQMFDDNIDGIQNLETFLQSKRKQFVKLLKSKANIQPAISGKLYN
eukprot:138162_1